VASVQVAAEAEPTPARMAKLKIAAPETAKCHIFRPVLILQNRIFPPLLIVFVEILKVTWKLELENAAAGRRFGGKFEISLSRPTVEHSVLVVSTTSR
jgi:hypothetical protein